MKKSRGTFVRLSVSESHLPKPASTGKSILKNRNRGVETGAQVARKRHVLSRPNLRSSGSARDVWRRRLVLQQCPALDAELTVLSGWPFFSHGDAADGWHPGRLGPRRLPVRRIDEIRLARRPFAHSYLAG